MRIVAYMPVLDEADILPHVLAHMRREGVEVHALDGWSQDGSYELLASYGPGVTVERFPADAPSDEWACRPTLRRIEDLAESSGADWCYLSDADEFRLSDRPGETLAEAIARIDREGYTAIDHRVASFVCTDDGWDEQDPQEYFRWHDPNDMICRLPQEKAWKNVGPVNLVDRGGHVVKFPGKRVYPERFLMKHYPYRTPEQARRKIETRLSRRCHTEHAAGWGVHYDAFWPGFSFCWDTAALREFRA